MPKQPNITPDVIEDAHAVARVTEAILRLEPSQLENSEIVRAALGSAQLQRDLARLTSRHPTERLVSWAREHCASVMGLGSEFARRAAAAWGYLKTGTGKRALGQRIDELKAVA